MGYLLAIIGDLPTSPSSRTLSKIWLSFAFNSRTPIVIIFTSEISLNVLSFVSTNALYKEWSRYVNRLYSVMFSVTSCQEEHIAEGLGLPVCGETHFQINPLIRCFSTARTAIRPQALTARIKLAKRGSCVWPRL